MTTTIKPPISKRAEPIFGVCEALGDDFGINPHWIRAAIVPLLIWQPLWTFAGYALVGLIVLASRLVFPDVQEAQVAVPAVSEPETANDVSVEEQRQLAA